jgi:ammonia channel protein AmtB
LVGGFETDRDDLATIPLQSRMVFQLKFAAIVPALITGAFTADEIRLGRRPEFPSWAVPSNSVVISFIGARLLWIGLHAGSLVAASTAFEA